ncbi:MAG: SDR family NAD(P)-dependent oxidoreductase [Pseudomonadales bacterium]|nr:SDR family NAD(P)-dependent oxidoreductase [Pseudomonadales bacterium]
MLDGKVAIITGAGTGIGRAHAHLFAAQGARVLVNDTGAALDGTGSSAAAETVAAEIRAAGGEAVADTTSVASFEGANAIVSHAVERFGQLDILVNNAGILRDRTLLKMNPEEWQAVLDVHLTGTFACLQAAARRMKDQGTGGRIVNTSSSSGTLGNFGQINYGAAKAGIHALTRIASMELARYSITVNAIAPNAYTRMTRDLPGIAAMNEANYGPQFMAPLVCYLASDEAGHVTGQTFGVNVNHLFVYKMMTSQGVDSMGGEPWDPARIGAVIDRVINW